MGVPHTTQCLVGNEPAYLTQKYLTGQTRKQTLAITQASAEGKIKRTLTAKATTDGAKLYRVGDLVDYKRQPNTKDEDGGLHGSYLIVKNLPDRGKLVSK